MNRRGFLKAAGAFAAVMSPLGAAAKALVPAPIIKWVTWEEIGVAYINPRAIKNTMFLHGYQKMYGTKEERHE